MEPRLHVTVRISFKNTNARTFDLVLWKFGFECSWWVTILFLISILTNADWWLELLQNWPVQLHMLYVFPLCPAFTIHIQPSIIHNQFPTTRRSHAGKKLKAGSIEDREKRFVKIQCSRPGSGLRWDWFEAAVVAGAQIGLLRQQPLWLAGVPQPIPTKTSTSKEAAGD